MQRQAAAAYSQTASKTLAPRDLEANLLSRSAARLQRIRDGWAEGHAELSTALNDNRRLWNVFLSSVTRDDNPLPRPIKQNVANLGLFVMKHTMSAMTRPAAGKLDVLININRQLAAGLRASDEG
jgi:flagellar biosynthesis activator protein FlaF